MRHLRASVVAAVVLGSPLAGCLKDERPPIDFVLPANFEGGFAIVYGVADAPPLPTKEGRLQVVVPPGATPLILTSSTPQDGWARDRYLMAGIPLSPKLVHHHALAAVDAGQDSSGASRPACVFEHAVIGHQLQADGHLKAIQDRLKVHCGL
jgi:hypothetical protein